MARMASWKGKTAATLIANGSNTTLDTIYIRDGAANLWAEVANSTDKALDAFIISVSPHSDASFHTIANSTADYTTGIQPPLYGCDADMTALAASATGLFWMDVKGIYAVKLQASAAATSDTYLTLRWNVR